MQNVKLEDNEILVSFDVVSLFTNVPVDESCKIAKDRLLSDDSLSKKLPLLLRVYMIY